MGWLDLITKKGRCTISHFSVIKTKFSDVTCLVAALMECGDWKAEQIEVHGIPVNLYGYQGDKRDQVANVVIRRQHVGGASNDIGYVKAEDGTYSAVISDYDRGYKYGESFTSKVTQRYGVNVVKKEALSRGHGFYEETKADGNVYVKVTSY